MGKEQQPLREKIWKNAALGVAAFVLLAALIQTINLKIPTLKS